VWGDYGYFGQGVVVPPSMYGFGVAPYGYYAPGYYDYAPGYFDGGRYYNGWNGNWWD
jgi:hypothetical protein